MHLCHIVFALLVCANAAVAAPIPPYKSFADAIADVRLFLSVEALVS
jgi:hypothetical protein